MKYEWDETKRKSNLIKHEIDFEDTVSVFDDFTYTEIDDRFEYGEMRWITFGLLFGAIVAISHTEDDRVIRIISARRAEKYEEEKYYKSVRD